MLYYLRSWETSTPIKMPYRHGLSTFCAKILHSPHRLTSSPRDEEPLIDVRINRTGQLLLPLWHLALQRHGIHPLGRVPDRPVRQTNIPWLGLARDQPLPRLSAFPHNIHSVLPILAFPTEGELILRLPVRDLIDAEPLVRRAEQAGEVTLHVLDVIEFGGERVVDVDDDDLPVGLFLVEEGHHAEGLDLLDGAWGGDRLANLTYVEGVVVAFGFGFGVDRVGVFPGLVVGC